MKNYCEMAIEILHETHDGNDLAPHHLYLLQTAVNGWLTEAGDVAFIELYANVTQPGGYRRPWFYGVENLSKDHEGFVYWKGVQIEHFSYRDGDAEREAAQELWRRCRHLESLGKEVNLRAVVWDWVPVET